MSKHTEGPWTVEPTEDRGIGIASPSGKWVAKTMDAYDARLIAAAPTMAAYLERKAAEGDTEAQAILDTIA